MSENFDPDAVIYISLAGSVLLGLGLHLFEVIFIPSEFRKREMHVTYWQAFQNGVGAFGVVLAWSLICMLPALLVRHSPLEELLFTIWTGGLCLIFAVSASTLHHVPTSKRELIRRFGESNAIPKFDRGLATLLAIPWTIAFFVGATLNFYWIGKVEHLEVLPIVGGLGLSTVLLSIWAVYSIGALQKSVGTTWSRLFREFRANTEWGWDRFRTNAAYRWEVLVPAILILGILGLVGLGPILYELGWISQALRNQLPTYLSVGYVIVASGVTFAKKWDGAQGSLPKAFIAAFSYLALTPAAIALGLVVRWCLYEGELYSVFALLRLFGAMSLGFLASGIALTIVGLFSRARGIVTT